MVENAEPGYAGLIASLVITLEDGQIIQQGTSDSWKSTDTIGDDWMTRPLDASAWAAARVLGDYGVQALGQAGVCRHLSSSRDLFPQGIPHRQTRGPRHALRHRAGSRGHAPQRPARQR